MSQLYECIATAHDLRLVLAAGVICLFACYTALSLLERARAAERTAQYSWLAGAAVVAGCGIWATHFVAMLAFRQNLPTGYDVGLTGLSIAIAVAITWAGFSIALYRPRYALAAGAIAGAAVGAMHFVGMAALRVPAEMQWDAAYVAASLVIGTVLAAIALQVASMPGSMRATRLGGAFLLWLAIIGLHFTAMTAVTLTPDPRVPLPDSTIDAQWLAIAIVAVTVLIIAIGMIGSVVDQHLADRSAKEAERLRAYVAELETTRAALEETAASLTLALDAAAASSQAKSQFLATMSHELRTPLNAVIGFSDLIATETYGPLGDARYREYARIICDSGAHLLGLINDVLDLSKFDAGRLDLQESTFDIARLLEDAVRMIGRQAEKANVRLEQDIASGLPRVHADERRVRQVVLNLLSNAVKFTSAGGWVRISARRRDGALAITVADNGIGIAPEDIPRALERFGQIDNSLERKYDGTGLGLPLSKCLMELHGGGLALSSALHTGTTAVATLPEWRLIATQSAAA